MKSFMYLIVFLLVGGFICAKTRPEKSDHINTLTETLIDEVKSGNIVSGVTESQISAVASKSNLVREFVGKMLHIDNYVVFTIGKVKWNAIGDCGSILSRRISVTAVSPKRRIIASISFASRDSR